MTNFKKLFLYAFATGMERLRDSRGALRYIDDILSTEEEILWQELLESIQQANRINILGKYNIDMTLGQEIDVDKLPDGVLNELMDNVITLEDLKRTIEPKINKRGHTK